MTLADIEQLFTAKGERMYAGEPVTQLEHALQTAQLAEQANASAALVTAALLHDVGHLINDQGTQDNGFTPTMGGIDDRHEHVAIPRLRHLFDDEVLAPIRLHVEAKRYLCARGDGILSGPQYFASLSADSVRSLQLQGGVFSEVDADRFIMQPHAPDAVRLRRWDDLAKVAGQPTARLAHYLALAASVARS
jgi:phosphonate degradation associated HDIG domain protein